MLWEDRVENWKKDIVTKAFFADMENDLQQLIELLINEEDQIKVYKLQGMIAAIRGVIGAPNDGIPDPNKGDDYVH